MLLLLTTHSLPSLGLITNTYRTSDVHAAFHEFRAKESDKVWISDAFHLPHTFSQQKLHSASPHNAFTANPFARKTLLASAPTSLNAQITSTP